MAVPQTFFISLAVSFRLQGHCWYERITLPAPRVGKMLQTLSSPHVQASRHAGFVELSKPFLRHRNAGTKGQLTQTSLSQSGRCPSLAGRPGQSQSQLCSGWGLFCRSYYTKAALMAYTVVGRGGTRVLKRNWYFCERMSLNFSKGICSPNPG